MGRRQKRRPDDHRRKSGRYAAGVFVIHGIGRQSEGSTAAAIRTALTGAMRAMDYNPSQSSPSLGTGTSLVECSGKSILISEGYWANPDRRVKARDLPKFVLWVLASLPMIPYLIMDSVGGTRTKSESAHFLRRLVDQLKSDMRWMLGSPRVNEEGIGVTWRALSAVGWIVAVTVVGSAIVATLGPVVSAMAGVFCASTALWFLLSKYNILDQVRMASVHGIEVDKILESLEWKLSQLSQRCDRTVVVAHSQGGYLSYLLLQRESVRRSVESVYTVGSGLRGIYAISNMNLRNGFIFLFAAALATASTFVYIPVFDAFLAQILSGLRSTLGGLSEAVFLANLNSESALAVIQRSLSGAWDGMFATPIAAGIGAITPTMAVVFVLSVSLLIVRIVYELRKRHSGFPVSDIAVCSVVGVRTWEEFFTRGDLVGRVDSADELSGIKSVWLPGIGTPLRHHSLAQCLDLRLPLSYLLAERILRIARVEPRRLNQFEADRRLSLQRTEAQHKYMYRAYLLANLLAVLCLSRFAEHGVSVAEAAIPVATCAVLSLALGMWQSKSIARNGERVWSVATTALSGIPPYAAPTDMSGGKYIRKSVSFLFCIAVSATFLDAVRRVEGAPGIWVYASELSAFCALFGFLFWAPMFGAGGPRRSLRAAFCIANLVPISLLVVGIGSLQTAYFLGLPLFLVSAYGVLSSELFSIRPVIVSMVMRFRSR